MVYYHVRLSVQGQRHDEIKLDVDSETLESQFLAPYREGAPITINGRVVYPNMLERIRIGMSDWASSQMIAQLQAQDRNSPVASFGGPSYQSRAAAKAKDVTDQFIMGPPGAAASSLVSSSNDEAEASLRGPGDRRSVFVVTGRDNAAHSSVTAFLRSLGLRIVEWEHALAKTGLPNPYVGDVVMKGLTMADAVVVLFTPDDLVELRPDLVRDDDDSAESERMGQARPNVYYEAGIADALGRDRTVLVEIGKVKSFSDAAGRHVVRFDGSPARRNALAERLRVAGLEPDTSGNDWLSVGNVAEAITAAQAAQVSTASLSECVTASQSEDT